MSVCYSSTGTDGLELRQSYGGVDLISITFRALHLPVNENVFCPEAAPRIKYQASAADARDWADRLQSAIDSGDVALHEAYSEGSHLIGGFDEYLRYLGEWVDFLRCGGYTTD